MPGFKNFLCARILLGGIEIAHMAAKGQVKDNDTRQTFVKQFYSLAA